MDGRTRRLGAIRYSPERIVPGRSYSARQVQGLTEALAFKATLGHLARVEPGVGYIDPRTGVACFTAL